MEYLLIYYDMITFSPSSCPLTIFSFIFVWIEVRAENGILLICNVYRPPDAQEEWMQDFAVMMVKAANEKGDRIVFGDFNCDVLKSDSCTNKLLGIGLEYGLVQLINCPTRVTEATATTIDLMFTSVPMLLTKFGCEEVVLSDHAWANLWYGAW